MAGEPRRQRVRGRNEGAEAEPEASPRRMRARAGHTDAPTAVLVSSTGATTYRAPSPRYRFARGCLGARNTGCARRRRGARPSWRPSPTACTWIARPVRARPVTRVLPLEPSATGLLRIPENLRVCPRCDELIGLDVSDCPYCGLRQPAPTDPREPSTPGRRRPVGGRDRSGARWRRSPGAEAMTRNPPPRPRRPPRRDDLATAASARRRG